MKIHSYFKMTVILSFIILLSACSKSPESTIESFYRALAKGEITEAKSYLSSELGDLLGEEKLNSTLANETEKIQTCGGLKNIETQASGEGEVRSVTATITYSDSEKCPVKKEKIQLIKSDGKWKLTMSK